MKTIPQRSRRVLSLIVLVLIFGFAFALLSLPKSTTFSQVEVTEVLPTPWPTIVLPPMTPVPTSISPLEIPTLTVLELELTSVPAIPAPNDPFQLTIVWNGPPNTSISVQQATEIVIGTVKQVLPAQWSTIDGQRPANPHETTDEGYGKYTIFRPVVLEVEQYIVGQEGNLQLILYADGGTIGEDFVKVEPDDAGAFVEGERVLVILAKGNHILDKSPLYHVLERYIVTEDGQAINSSQNIALEQLLREINEARNQKSSK